MRMTRWQRFLFARSGEFARMVAQLLTEEPEAWSNDRGFWLSHEGCKLAIWIANEAYSLRIRQGPLGRGFPTELTPRWAERMLLWSLIKARRELATDAFERQMAADTLRRRRGAA